MNSSIQTASAPPRLALAGKIVGRTLLVAAGLLLGAIVGATLAAYFGLLSFAC